MASANIHLRVKDGTYDFPCEDGERVLYAGLRAGIPMPHECATGICGNCRGRLFSGDIEELWTEAPGRQHLKTSKGDFLLCQARARSDCEVRIPTELNNIKRSTYCPAYHRGVLGNLRKLTSDVISFDLELEQPLSFEAGQFVVVEAPGITGFRPYSMTNYGQDTRNLQFVIKRKPGGGFSEWLFDGKTENAEVNVFGPLGRATFDPTDDRDLLCIAGGSGIAGIMSILTRASNGGYFEKHKGNVFFGVRTLKDQFFLDELAAFAATNPENLKITIALSDEAPQDATVLPPGITHAQGFVHEAAAEAMVGHFENTLAFVGGPPLMVDGAIRMLIVTGKLPVENIRYDKFS